MGPAVRRTRPQSRITAAAVQDPNYSGPKVGIASAVRSNFALKARLLGTDFPNNSLEKISGISDRITGIKIAISGFFGFLTGLPSGTRGGGSHLDRRL